MNLNIIIIYIRKHLLLNSMKIKNCILFLFLLINIHSHNLVADSGFQSLNVNLTETFLGTQSYTYRILLNGQSNWYSTISGGILVREYISLNTTVIDSVNNNSHEKICQDFNILDSKPYQLSFDSFIDNNIGWALLAVSFNGISLFFGHIINKIPATKTYTVYLTQNVNVLCFEGWASASQSSKIGALIDNVVLAPFDVRYINFEASPSPKQLNIIYLVSNETVINENELNVFKNELKLQIPNLQYNLIEIDKNQNSNLIIAIEIKNQYASSQTLPAIVLPTHRNLEGQIILYYTSALNLPRYLYSSVADNEMVSGSYFYLIILVKIYNVIYRVIKIIGFAFVGIRFLGGFYLLLFLGFLDLEYIMPAVRNIIQEFMTLTINTQTINFFVFLTRHQLLDYGASSIPIAEQFLPRNSNGVEYSSANVTPNLYSLIIDDLFVAIFSTLKIVVFYHLIFKGSKRFMKIFKRVKNQKILLQYITIFSVIILAAGIFWRGERIVNFYGKINRVVSFLIPIVSTFLCLIIFINDHNNMIAQYRNASKGKKKLKANEKIRKYYQSQIIISLVENLMFIIVPALVGLGYVYLSLSVYLWMILLKLKFMIKGLRNKNKLINFFWFISYLVEFSLVAFFMMAKLLESFTDLSSSSEITWMIILKYNSVGLIFMYVAVGFIETVCTITNFVQGLMSLEYSCPIRTNKISNEFNQNQIKVEEITHSQFLDSTGIKVLNQLKQKVQGASNSITSTQKIPNPFIKSSESISIEISHKKQINEVQLSNEQKKQVEGIKTKVIKMKNIGPEGFALTPIKSQRPKSAFQQENYERSKKQKKPMKQKSLKLIKKLQISYVKQQQPLQEPQTLKHMVVSNFEKQENFS